MAIRQLYALYFLRYGTFPSGYIFLNHSVHFEDFVTNALKQKEHVMGVYLDIKKAFDSVDHSILLSKLSHYGLRGKILDLLQNYLDNRSQSVKINTQCVTKIINSSSSLIGLKMY